jgi:hypothetical protein
VATSTSGPLQTAYFDQQGIQAQYDARAFASSPKLLEEWNTAAHRSCALPEAATKQQQDMQDAVNSAIVPNSLESNFSKCPSYKSFEKRGREDGCSLLVSSGQKGQKFQEQVTATTQGLAKYCENYNTPDCACIAPNNKIYDAISSRTSIDSACWWKPCSSPRFLGASKSKCPSTTCQEIQDIVENSNIDGQKAQRWLSCTLLDNEEQLIAADAPQQTSAPSVQTQDNASSSTPQTGFSLTTVVLLGAGVLVIVLVIGVVIYVNR